MQVFLARCIIIDFGRSRSVYAYVCHYADFSSSGGSTMMLIEHFSWFDGVILCAVAAVILLGLFTKDTAEH